MVIVGTTWQPDGGIVGGALQCDGVTGCVHVDRIPDLGPGPFSVIAWVKGGAPGQTVLSHKGTTALFMANPIDGSLMTMLENPKKRVAQGSTEAIITDGRWHRIALVWDGVERQLYVDGQEVALEGPPFVARWVPSPGAHVIAMELDGQLADQVRLWVGGG